MHGLTEAGVKAAVRDDLVLEAAVREELVAIMPLEHTPAHLRLAFHDAGTYDARTGTGGAHASVRLPERLRRGELWGWGPACIDLLGEVKTRYPDVSWADLVMLGGAAAVQRARGPLFEVGLGRTDADTAPPPHRLPGGYESATLLKTVFARMGLGPRELVALSGAHTLGFAQRRPFTPEPWVFSNAYFRQLLSGPVDHMLITDQVLLGDPELRPLVELYAADASRFFGDFIWAYRRLSWLGNDASRTPQAWWTATTSHRTAAGVPLSAT